MNYQRILNAYNPNHDLPGAGQPPVTWVEMQLAEQVKYLTIMVEQHLIPTIDQLRAELEKFQEGNDVQTT